MMNSVTIDTGASRPPFSFVLSLLAVTVALLCAVAPQPATAAKACTYVDGRSTWGEWIEGGQLQGAVLSIRDEGWRWADAHGGTILFCASCAHGGGVTNGMLRLGLAPFLASDDERTARKRLGQEQASATAFALHPENVGIAVWLMTNAGPQRFEAVTEPSPFALGDAKGLARVVATRDNGRTQYGVAVALEERCFSMFGVFFREDVGAALTVDALQPLASALTVQWYTPAQSRGAVPQVRQPPTDFLLGDARKRGEGTP